MMKLFEMVREMEHEQVLFCHDPATKLKAIVALHDTTQGRAMGATRLWSYANEEDALTDVLRLSRGMTYKAACANIPVGGAKGVIIANPQDKTNAMLSSYARFVNRLNGRFITGQDVNLSVEDVRIMHQETNYVVGTSEQGGGPTMATALGVCQGIEAAVEFRWQRKDLEGLKIAVQGVGNVGRALCHYLHAKGAKLFVSDLHRERTELVKQLYGATIVEPEEIYSLAVDIFSPCALGGAINSSTVSKIQAPIIAGCANNQLQNERKDAELLQKRNIIYCPDYVINAGGLIHVYHEMIGYNAVRVERHIHHIRHTLLEIFSRARYESITTNQAARNLAEDRRSSTVQKIAA